MNPILIYTLCVMLNVVRYSDDVHSEESVCDLFYLLASPMGIVYCCPFPPRLPLSQQILLHSSVERSSDESEYQCVSVSLSLCLCCNAWLSVCCAECAAHEQHSVCLILSGNHERACLVCGVHVSVWRAKDGVYEHVCEEMCVSL